MEGTEEQWSLEESVMFVEKSIATPIKILVQTKLIQLWQLYLQ